MMQADAALTAVTRFGLGPKPHDIARIRSDPRGYVRDQCFVDGAAIPDDPALMDHDTLRQAFRNAQLPFREAVRTLRDATDDNREMLEAARQALAQDRRDMRRGIQEAEIGGRFRHGATTDNPFVERLVLFWSNHFTVNFRMGIVLAVTTGLFEREAIRANVLGYFEDMLSTAVLHPAMLNYLDNQRSIGPNSRAGRRRGNVKVNENLAREVLELHTLGVNGGYTQDDVVELALALTGWRGGFSARERSPAFARRWHEPGYRTVLGKTYPAGGADQVRPILADLAKHPATAKHLAGKLARHFVGDTASQALIADLETAYRDTGGDLREMAIVLAEHEDAWTPPPAKTVPPYDFMVATARATGVNDVPVQFIRQASRAMAHEIWSAPSPAGWPDADNAFLGGDSLLERVDFARAFSRRYATTRDVKGLADSLYGDLLDPFLEEAIVRAEDHYQGLVLLLMSPTFHRR
ncbi:MAG: DUF1800 domain-containing protein [Pseudomonadota bacterium]